MKLRSIHTPLLLVLLFTSCHEEKKVCEFNSTNERILIYNHILGDMVENYMHGKYLGAGRDAMLEEYYAKVREAKTGEKVEFDTIAEVNMMVRMHNEIFNRPSEFCVIYLDTLAFKEKLVYDSIDTSSFAYQDMKVLLDDYKIDVRLGIERLFNQAELFAPDFQLCTIRVDDIRNESDDVECWSGRIYFSEYVLNETKDKGLVYYHWICGELCGHDGMLRIEKSQGRWKIATCELWSVH